MSLQIPLEEMIFDTKESKYKLVLEAVQKAKRIKQQRKEVNSGEKLIVLALKEVLESKSRR